MLQAPPETVTVCSERSVDSYIRGSEQGGTCYPQKGYYISEDVERITGTINISNLQEKLKITYKAVMDLDDEKLKILYDNCNHFIMCLDACSLYASAQWKYDYPSGKPLWNHNEQSLIDSLNNCDVNLPFGIVECEIIIPPNICLILSYKHPDGRLQYLTGTQRLRKTTVDIMQAVKYNGARVTKIFTALYWEDKAPIYRKSMSEIYPVKQQATEEGNSALAEGAKLLLTSSYGKNSQRHHDDKTVITSDEIEINKIYQNSAGVPVDEVLNNGEQCFLQFPKNRLSRVKNPSHIGSFILANSRVIMNELIASFGGFTDWKKAYYYRDTDSVYVTNDIFNELKQNTNFIGGFMCQFKDDIKEVINGKIILAIFVRPKLYILIIIGISKKCPKCNKKGICEKHGHYICKECGFEVVSPKFAINQKVVSINPKVVVVPHVRAKGIKKQHHKELKFETFVDMLFEHKVVKIEGISRFARSFKYAEEPAIKTVISTKEMNKDVWDGRNWNEELNRFETYDIKDFQDNKEDESEPNDEAN